jgi:hypothetical protein
MTEEKFDMVTPWANNNAFEAIMRADALETNIEATERIIDMSAELVAFVIERFPRDQIQHVGLAMLQMSASFFTPMSGGVQAHDIVAEFVRIAASSIQIVADADCHCPACTIKNMRKRLEEREKILRARCEAANGTSDSSAWRRPSAGATEVGRPPEGVQEQADPSHAGDDSRGQRGGTLTS